MKEEFKQFVSSHPELVKFVNSGKMTWQKFYEMYSLYGSNKEVWSDYFSINKEQKNNMSVSDLVEAIKKVDVDTIQKNITTINKALALIGSLLTKEEVDDVYTPRPLYKKFED